MGKELQMEARDKWRQYCPGHNELAWDGRRERDTERKREREGEIGPFARLPVIRFLMSHYKIAFISSVKHDII